MTDTAGRTAVSPTGTAGGHRPVDIPALTGVRAVAAVIVVAHHLRPMVDWFAPAAVADAVRPVLASGVPSLDVFFLLSGFIIAHNYAHVLTDAAPGARRKYLHARVARIYPLHLVTFLVFCAILAAGALLGRHDGVPHTVVGFVANALMLQGLPGVMPWNYPSWSLTGEFAMYLVFPLLAACVLRLRSRTALVVAGLALTLQLVVMFGLANGDPGSTVMGWPRVMGEFTAGAMAWVVWSRVLRPGLWGDVVVVLCTVAAWWLMLTGHSWLWTVPLFAVMVPAVASATGPVGRLLAHPLTQWGGRLSFAVYLVHSLVIWTAVMFLIPAEAYTQHSTSRALLITGSIFVASWVLGALLHHRVEEPARRRLRRHLDRRPARVAADRATVALTPADLVTAEREPEKA